MAKRKAESGEEELTEELILAAFEKLFKGKGVRRYSHSKLRHVWLPGDALLVEQNPRKESEWAKLARGGHKVAWAIRGDEYLARVIDGRVEMLGLRNDK